MSAIFISYRREDSEDAARALYESLVPLFGRDQLFMDVEAIALGSDFRDAIERSLATCGVFLAMIGPDWLNTKQSGDASGPRRLDNPTDFVRQEIATALKKGADLPVIPVLVRGANMPAADHLPEDLKNLAYRNALTLTHSDWDGSVNRLVEAIRPHVAEPKDADQFPAGSLTKSGAAARGMTPNTLHTPPPETRFKTGMFAAIVVLLVLIFVAFYFFLHANSGSSSQALNCTLVRNPNLSNLPGPVDVSIDGQQIGQLRSEPDGSTPLQFRVAAGEHQFKLVDQERHASCSGTFSVNANQTRFLPRIRAGGTGCAFDVVTR